VEGADPAPVMQAGQGARAGFKTRPYGWSWGWEVVRRGVTVPTVFCGCDLGLRRRA
jgi:hypothetical protein